MGGKFENPVSRLRGPQVHRFPLAEYVALLAYAQEVKFVNMLLEEMTEVQKPSVVYKDNKGAGNRQVGMRTKHIDSHHHFMRNMLEDKGTGIKYIRIE